MMIAIGLGILGLFLIYFEFFVPGAVLGVLGGVLMLVGVALFAMYQTHTYFIIIYLSAAGAGLVFTVRFALYKVRQKPAMFASGDQSGYVASKFDEELIGKVGTVITNLKPSGHIRVDGQRYQAVSESSFIKKGETVKIISGEGARYKVRIHNG